MPPFQRMNSAVHFALVCTASWIEDNGRLYTYARLFERFLLFPAHLFLAYKLQFAFLLSNSHFILGRHDELDESGRE